MTLFLFIKQAFSSIWANKLRSFLSTLGIVIGISSFVIMLSIGAGAQESILSNVGDSGKILTVSASSSSDAESKDIFTEEIATEMATKVPGVERVLVGYGSPSGDITYEAQSVSAQVSAIGSEYFSIKDLSIQYGTDFSSSDFENAEKFAIIGNGLIEESDSRFRFSDSPMVGLIPIGDKIVISGETFIIVGVLEESNYDQVIFIPNTTYKKIFSSSISSFEVYAESEDQVESLQEKLEYFLFKKAALDDGDDATFSVSTNSDMIESMDEMVSQFTLLLGGIGAIALIVGGIGIMNIMVVSVTERTREIGIRKAIGATNKNILFQFLVESVILTLFGSLIAIALSQGVVVLLGNIMDGFNPVISSAVLTIAVCVSVSMGIIFGLMPAYKAAKLKIIDALHFE